MIEIKEEGQLQGWQQEAVNDSITNAVDQFARSQHGGRLRNPIEATLWSGAQHVNGQFVWFHVTFEAWPTGVGVKKLTIFDDEQEFDAARAAFDAQPNGYDFHAEAEMVKPGEEIDFNRI